MPCLNVMKKCESMPILVVGAHPDDLEMLCGGTLALYARRGDAVIMASACTGDRDDPDILPEEMAHIRFAEATAAAEPLP